VRVLDALETVVAGIIYVIIILSMLSLVFVF
jgi:hypothetical protein